MRKPSLVVRYEEGQSRFVDQEFRDMIVSDVTLGAIKFVRCTFDSVRFVQSALTYVSFIDCQFRNVTFDRIGMQWAAIDSSIGENVVFVNSGVRDSIVQWSTLSEVYFEKARLLNVTWRNDNLREFRLDQTRIGMTTFTDCAIHDLRLSESGFSRSDFMQCDITDVWIFDAVFTACRVDGLCHSQGKASYRLCTVDWSTICLSAPGEELESWLMASGMPPIFATYSVVSARAVDPSFLERLMRSTFISYGSPDADFARRLQVALRRHGVATFFFDEDATPGAKLHDVMRDGVNGFERVVLICSKSSLDRPGVRNEIQQALAREARLGGASLLIPVTLDDYVFSWNSSPPGIAQELRDRVVADFREAAENEDKFEGALRRLLIALEK